RTVVDEPCARRATERELGIRCRGDGGDRVDATRQRIRFLLRGAVAFVRGDEPRLGGFEKLSSEGSAFLFRPSCRVGALDGRPAERGGDGVRRDRKTGETLGQ